MYKKLNESINTKRNEIQTELIKNSLTNLKKDTNKTPKDFNIIEHILYLNEENQQGSGLKILTPYQMLNRLPISLAQLNARNK